MINIQNVSYQINHSLLVLGQTIFEHLMGMKAVLSVVVEFVGGIIFLLLILRRKT